MKQIRSIGVINLLLIAAMSAVFLFVTATALGSAHYPSGWPGNRREVFVSQLLAACAMMLYPALLLCFLNLVYQLVAYLQQRKMYWGRLLAVFVTCYISLLLSCVVGLFIQFFLLA